MLPKLKTNSKVVKKKKMTGQEAIRRMITHAYRGKKAPTDLSTNDDYF